MSDPKELNRDKAAKAVFAHSAIPFVDGPYKDSALNIRVADAHEWSVRTGNCFKNEMKRLCGVEFEDALLGDLAQVSEAQLLRIPNFGQKGLNEIKGVLAREGARLETKPERRVKEPGEAPAPIPLPSIETHDELTTIADQMLPPGAVGYVPNAQKADVLVKAAKAVFATSDGEHREGAGVKGHYSFAIKRLPPQGTDKGKVYPVYLSDAALKVLSQPKALNELDKKKNELFKQSLGETIR